MSISGEVSLDVVKKIHCLKTENERFNGPFWFLCHGKKSSSLNLRNKICM